MTPTQADLDDAARTVWAEARGEGDLGMVAVACVLVNRWRKPCWWSRDKGDDIPDDTLQAVCRDPWQFSCWNLNDPNREKLLALSAADPMFRRAMVVVLQAIDIAGTDKDPSRGATHYHTTAMGFPTSWGDRSKYEERAVIFHHRFYVEVA